MSIASSHWHGDVTSDRFQRVYGTAFYDKKDLAAYLELLEQAKERDHRVIGKRLGLFEIDDKVGQGLVLWKPKGAAVREQLQRFISDHLERQGYHQVFTPHIGKLGLYKHERATIRTTAGVAVPAARSIARPDQGSWRTRVVRAVTWRRG